MHPKELQIVVHFDNILHDNDTTFESLYASGEPEQDEDDEVTVLDPKMIHKAVEFIDSLGNGDGEVEMHELRMAFRRARQLVVQSNPTTEGRSKVRSERRGRGVGGAKRRSAANTTALARR